MNPLGETVGDLTVCGLLDFGFHFGCSPPEWDSVGEAEAGAGGDQLAKE